MCFHALGKRYLGTSIGDNDRRLLDAIGYVPPAEFEKAYHHNREESADAA